MKKVFSYAIILFCLIYFTGCNPTGPTSASPLCDTTNTPFKNLYSTLAAIPGNTDTHFYDVVSREYDFELNAPDTICSIGYQAEPGIPGGAYEFYIIDNVTTATLYSGTLSFSAAYTQFISIPPVPIAANHSYKIKRRAPNYAGNIGNTIGRIITNGGGFFTFPVIVGSMKITGTKFYEAGATSTNSWIPYMDFGTY